MRISIATAGLILGLSTAVWPGVARAQLERDSLSAADSLAVAAAEADSLPADSLAADSAAHRGPKELEVFGRSLFRRLTAGETLGDAHSYAGGLQAEAVARRVQVDRILPPGERRNGVDRVLVDVDVRDLEKAGEGGVPLRDGDLVQVFAVSEERRHRVVVTGQVRQPGVYEWNQGTTLWDLVDRAQGFDERAYTPRAHIFRLNPDDGSRRLIRTELLADSTGRPVPDVVLSDRDSVVIFSLERLKNPEFVTIDGFIERPGVYPLAEVMTLEDVILAAGGLIRGASISEAEVARFPVSGARTDTTAMVLHVPLEAAASSGGTAGGEAGRTKSLPAVEVAASRMPSWTPRADEFTLRHGDRIFVRKAPGYALARQVKVTGEVLIPGTYVLTSRQERLTDVVGRAGGLTREGFAPGFQLLRRGTVVPTDLERALKHPKSRYNVVLEPDDSLHVPQ